MQQYKHTPPPDELKLLKSGIRQFINKPTICPWQKGDKIEIAGWKKVTVIYDGNTFVYFGSLVESI